MPSSGLPLASAASFAMSPSLTLLLPASRAVAHLVAGRPRLRPGARLDDSVKVASWPMARLEPSLRSPGATPGARARRTTELILRTSKQIFLERGFGGTRIEHITEACGI